MRYIVLIMITLCSISCGKPKGKDMPISVRPFVVMFEHHWGKQIDNIFITFGDLPQGRAGECTNLSNGDIVIDTLFWAYATVATKEQLIFHELGHCVLGREHNAKIVNGREQSIMNPNLLLDSTYLPNRDEYIKELFQRK